MWVKSSFVMTVQPCSLWTKNIKYTTSAKVRRFRSPSFGRLVRGYSYHVVDFFFWMTWWILWTKNSAGETPMNRLSFQWRKWPFSAYLAFVSLVIDHVSIDFSHEVKGKFGRGTTQPDPETGLPNDHRNWVKTWPWLNDWFSDLGGIWLGYEWNYGPESSWPLKS